MGSAEIEEYDEEEEEETAFGSSSFMSSGRFSYRSRICMLTSGIVWGSVFLAAAYMLDDSNYLLGHSGKNSASSLPQIRGSDNLSIDVDNKSKNNNNKHFGASVGVPKELMGVVYHEKDFSNEVGVVPTYWDANLTLSFVSKTSPLAYDQIYGPCFGKINSVHNWLEEVDKERTANDNATDGAAAVYFPKQAYRHSDINVRGYCRPGFIILGAGKCGTSSLYHYLTEHPRVLPASEKQIHYFKYYTKRSMKWYLSHFPTAANFLATGALMTGEASPGYLPYPDVAHLLPSRMPGTRLIIVAREPIERAYSSFMYSYVNPLLDMMKLGRIHRVPMGLSREQYTTEYLFSFEETMRAELNVLKKCLAEHGDALIKAQMKWNTTDWGKLAFERFPGLADLDSYCYGSKVSDTVLRPQWAELNAQFPKKVIVDKNTHLLQSHLGRSIYVLPLEWWYSQYQENDIFFMCTEDMRDMSGSTMEPLRQWLGLPQFNFSSVIQQGAYNVGGHGNMAYDKETTWETATKPNATGGAFGDQSIPLSDELGRELREFLQPYNDRLFALVGKQCRW